MSNSKNHITKDGIRIHEKNDFLGMAKAGRSAADILDEVGDAIVPGIKTLEIDSIIHDMVVKSGPLLQL